MKEEPERENREDRQRDRGDVPGVSGRTGPLSATLEEQSRRKNKSGLETGQRETEETTEGAEEEERLKVSLSSTCVAQEQLGG